MTFRKHETYAYVLGNTVRIYQMVFISLQTLLLAQRKGVTFLKLHLNHPLCISKTPQTPLQRKCYLYFPSLILFPRAIVPF